MKASLLLLLLVFQVNVDLRAMIMRHDRPDSLYLELGNQFPCVGQIMRMGGATLIAPDVAVTAAHVAMAIQQRSPTVEFGGERYGIKEILIFPQTSQREFNPDLALLRLDREVIGIERARLYTLEPEAGKAVYFVGCGNSGNGNEGVTIRDGKRRGASNIVDSVSATELYFDLDSAEGATELEGINGPGDSGSPTLYKEDGKVYLAGVSSRGVPGPQGVFRYGCGDIHVRVKSFAGIIEELLINPEKWDQDGYRRIIPSERSMPELPEDARGDIISEFVRAFASRKSEEYERFSQRYRTAEVLAKRTPEERSEWYEQSLIDYGVIEPVIVREVNAEEIETQMITEIGALLTFRFTFSGDEPLKLESVSIE